MLVCVAVNSNTLPAIRERGGFTVNFLAAGSRHRAELLATKSEEKFEGLHWREPEAPAGGPILDQDSAAYIVCRTWRELPAGDHVVFIGEVLEGETFDGQLPLVYHQRGYREV